jgi:hypothetical protein
MHPRCRLAAIRHGLRTTNRRARAGSAPCPISRANDWPAGETAAGSVQDDVRRDGHQMDGRSRVRDMAATPAPRETAPASDRRRLNRPCHPGEGAGLDARQQLGVRSNSASGVGVAAVDSAGVIIPATIEAALKRVDVVVVLLAAGMSEPHVCG